MADFLRLFDLGNYALTLYSIPPLIVAILSVLFFHFFNHLEKKSELNQALGMVCLSGSIWLLGLGLAMSARSSSILYFWTHIMYIGVVLAPVHLFQASAVLAGRYLKQKGILFLLYGLALLTFIWETYFLTGFTIFPGGIRPFSDGTPQPLFVFVACCYILALVNLIYHHTHALTGYDRRKVRFFIITYWVFFLSYMDIFSESLYFPSIGYVPIFGFMVSLFSLQMKDHLRLVEERTEEQQREIEKKTMEISQIVGELKTIQLKLFETGKISAVASLSAGILHQISQPITAIHGFVKFIKKEMKQDDPFYKPICLMEEQSQYLKEMLEDLMELIRHREIKKENINVNVCLNRALNLLNDELRIRRVNWDLVLDEKLPAVHADSVHLQQVFMNVVINAIQALSLLPRGAARYLKISTEYNAQTNQIVITFKDTGPGLNGEDQKMIFEPFFSTKTKGTGIGLALCKDLVAEHGGSIDCLSTPGDGATFIIRLPGAEKAAMAKIGVQRI